METFGPLTDGLRCQAGKVESDNSARNNPNLSDSVPQLVDLKKALDALENVPIPFNLHRHIRDVIKDLEKMGY